MLLGGYFGVWGLTWVLTLLFGFGIDLGCLFAEFVWLLLGLLVWFCTAGLSWLVVCC